MNRVTNSRFFGIAVLLVVFCISDAILLTIGFVPVAIPTILALSTLGYMLHSKSYFDMTEA